MRTKVMALAMSLLVLALQALPAAVGAAACAGDLPSCTCCAGMDACPCAKSDPQPSPRQPLTTVDSQVFKLPPMRVDDHRMPSLAVVADAGLPSQIASAHERHVVGYHGVRHSVAFCSFIM